MARQDQPDNVAITGTSHSLGAGSILGIVLAGVVLAGIGVAFIPHLFRDGQAQEIKDTAKPPSSIFKDWDKPRPPDLVIVISGQMHGYLQPCGCSHPQYGGLARRYNVIKSLKDKWPVVAVDLGDIASTSSPQALLKYNTAMKALEIMGYTAIGLGKNEFYLPLIHVQEQAVNHDWPRVLAANLNDGVLSDEGKKSWVMAHKMSPSVAVLGLVGPSVVKQVSRFPNIEFARDNKDVIAKAMTQMAAEKPQLVVMLYQGTLKEAQSAGQFCAALRQKNPNIPAINVMLCLEEEEEPSGVPRQVGDTWVLGIGHKGRYVGVIGAYRDPSKNKFNLKYQLVSIGPEYETPKGDEKSNPILALMEQYAQDVKAGVYLIKFSRTKHPVQLAHPEAKFVGSERCASCHEHAFEVWKDSAHSHAFKTLMDAKNPGLRHFDGECVSCHTVGFNHQSGFADPANAVKQNQKLVNVGCESCHGPGSVHVADTRNKDIHALINPFKIDPNAPKAAQVQKLNQLDHFCQKCHDIDNDVNWGKVPFHTKWVDRKIIHTTPKAAGAKPAAANN